MVIDICSVGVTSRNSHLSVPPHISAVEEQRRQIVSLARRILDRDIGIVAGAREFSRLRFSSCTNSDSDVLVFVGIDSETDHLPIGDKRQHWSAEALKTKDAELQAYEARVRKRAFRACESLISRYGRVD